MVSELDKVIPFKPSPEPIPEKDGADSEAGGGGSAPSPFIEGTFIQYAWDSTSLEWFKRCPRLYQYQMIEGYRPKGESIDLRFGIEVHQALHDYDLSRAAGVNHDDSVHDVIQELVLRVADWDPAIEEYGDKAKYKNRDTLIRSVIWYLDHYKNDPAKTVIMSDGKPACEVSFRFELDWGVEVTTVDDEEGKGQTLFQPYLLCGHLDKVVEFNGELLTKDVKTLKSTPSSYFFDQFEPHNQMTLYTLAGKVLFDMPVRGVIIDAIATQIEGTQFNRGVTYRTPDQLDEWLKDLRFWTGKAEDYAAEGYWPMNDTACDKYGGCAFRGVCSKSPSVRQSFLDSDFTKEDPWNPLKPR